MTNLAKKGLTMTIVFEGESANYGEGLGNISELKKISRGDGNSYSYVSRQALIYDIKNQMNVNNTKLQLDKTVIQYDANTTIQDSVEKDLFGYMTTSKSKTKTKSAIVRVSNAIALESFNSDLDFLTNKNLFDRANAQGLSVKGGNISQSEIHKSYYAYTITIDLDKVGIDINDDVEISNEEKAQRIVSLLKTIKMLYRDIKGRRENLSPIFVVGGVYDTKNAFFENRVKVKDNKIEVEAIKDVIELDDEIANNTLVGIISNIFDNDEEIKEKLNATSIRNVFDSLEEKVKEYYLA